MAGRGPPHLGIRHPRRSSLARTSCALAQPYSNILHFTHTFPQFWGNFYLVAALNFGTFDELQNKNVFVFNLNFLPAFVRLTHNSLSFHNCIHFSLDQSETNVINFVIFV